MAVENNNSLLIVPYREPALIIDVQKLLSTLLYDEENLQKESDNWVDNCCCERHNLDFAILLSFIL